MMNVVRSEIHLFDKALSNLYDFLVIDYRLITGQATYTTHLLNHHLSFYVSD